jgi:predicted RND superfamily exporter protein
VADADRRTQGRLFLSPPDPRSPAAAARSLQDEQRQQRGEAGALWRWLDRFAERRNWALGAIAVSVLLGAAGFALSLKLQVGDLDPGAPELRADSRYNRVNAFVTKNYSLSSDLFAVIVKTPKEGCLKYDTLQHVDRLAWELQQLPQVQATLGVQDVVRQITAGSFEGNPKWLTISRNQDVLNYGAQQATVNNPELFNTECSVMPLIAYLSDHKADTLSQVLATVERFNATNPTDPVQLQLQLLPAAGPAGIEAATNIVVRQAWVSMLLYVYAAVVALCFITFRSWRAVLVAVLPLVLTSILCEALMVVLGIGVKVATLPGIALGVGIGVDYALYLLSVQLAGQRRGLTLAQAYGEAVMFTGRVVALVGVTLAAGVVTWAFSPIKFQADMGIRLTFMFLWNMVGALALIPALSYFFLNDRHVRVAGREASAGSAAALPQLPEASRT